jgi:type II secretory pathway pseudopilin PulG
MLTSRFFLGRRREQGFTLIEMLVYIAILMIVVGGALTLIFALGGRLSEQRADQLVTKSAQATLDHMLYSIRSSDTINDANTSSLVSPGVLVLTQGTTTHKYGLTSGQVVYTKNGVVQGPLTDARVQVDELRFFVYDNVNTEMVRVEMTLTAMIGKATTTKSFSAGATLRGSYD